MRRLPLRSLSFVALILLAVPSTALRAQGTAPAIAREQLVAYAKAHAAIGAVRDQLQAEMAQPQNKKDEAQKVLHDRLRTSVARAIQDNGLTEELYQRITYVIATDPEQRRVLDDIMGIKPPAPPPAPAASSGNPVQAHHAHLMTSFNGTPNNQGLVTTAVAEAKIVAQHAALAAKSTGNLDQMKAHAGHIIHSIDPTVVTSGPGAGYGLKKAASGVVTHVELAARSQGVPEAVTTHSVHIAVAARNTVTRADQILALAQQIQAATSAAAAAELVGKLNTVAEQLIAGADANGDGRIGWQENEGGLQHVEQHIGLMMAPPK